MPFTPRESKDGDASAGKSLVARRAFAETTGDADATTPHVNAMDLVAHLDSKKDGRASRGV